MRRIIKPSWSAVCLRRSVSAGCLKSSWSAVCLRRSVSAGCLKYSVSAVCLAVAAAATAVNPPVWSENFDDGMEGWNIKATNVIWETKQIAAGGAMSFSSIDPDDVQSLYIEGPTATYKREISFATSPEFTIPDNGSLEAWVGYSLNYDNYCRLTISVSDDNFATSEEVWNSANSGNTEKSWVWHKVSVQLNEYAGRAVRLRFTYGPGSDDPFNVGGYMGDFAIDGLKVNGKQGDSSGVETTVAAGSCKQLKIFDLSGRCVATATLDDSTDAIDTSTWPSGIYIVTAPGEPALKIMKR